jgi:glycosyltransferase involved in cell wall biosynthesis
MSGKKISIITTVFRGKDLIVPLIERIEANLVGFDNYEIILVDDFGK